jgi:hypothetical protein
MLLLPDCCSQLALLHQTLHAQQHKADGQALMWGERVWVSVSTCA